MNVALLIDDSITIREIISTYLQQEGFVVLTAANAKDGLAKLKIYKPDVIIADVVLPDISGFELCRELKAIAATHDIPVVLCSSKDTPLDKYWGLKQGAAAYITKPFVGENLVDTVKQVMAG
jgi:DNA-binding response OmpR family regulator